MMQPLLFDDISGILLASKTFVSQIQSWPPIYEPFLLRVGHFAKKKKQCSFPQE